MGSFRKRGVIKTKIFFLIFIIILSSCIPSVNTERCQPATAKQLDFINYAVGSLQASNYITGGWAVKSNDFENVYMVAVLIYGPSIEHGTGPAVFAVGGDPGSPHTWLSVDGFAKEFTELPDASKTDAEITISADGVKEVSQCAKEGK